MQFKQLLFMIATFFYLLANVALAGEGAKEIYKWKDKNGVVRYTDMPPPIGTKDVRKIKRKSYPKVTRQQSVNNKKPTGEMPPGAKAEMEARQKEMDRVAKQNEKVKAEDAKRKQLNCAAAKANYQSYAQGGRVYKTNANGEREYLDDEGLARGMQEAQRQINENCG